MNITVRDVERQLSYRLLDRRLPPQRTEFLEEY